MVDVSYIGSSDGCHGIVFFLIPSFQQNGQYGLERSIFPPGIVFPRAVIMQSRPVYERMGSKRSRSMSQNVILIAVHEDFSYLISSSL